MKILFLYTKRMLAANKARTAVTFAGIVLSFALLTAVLTGTSSLFHFFSEFMKVRDGDYYGVIYNCDEEDEARLAQYEEVTQSCRMGIVGVAEKGFGIEHELSLSNRVYVAIGSVDADFFDTMGVRLIEGRLPENENEVIIPQMMTTAGKEFHIGDTITWQIGKRIGSDGRVIQHQEQRREDRSNEDFCEKETIQAEHAKTYTIVGISTNPGYQMFAEPCYLVLTTGVHPTTLEMSPNDRKFMDKLVGLMEQNMDNGELVVDDLVRELAVSRSVFFKKLKTLTGLAPIEFIKEMRIKRATQLIETGEFNMTQISYMVGINDPRYFSKCFKAQVGMTPTEYRDRVGR